MLSRRIRNMTLSATVELTTKITELRRRGEDIISLNVGEPDFGTPKNVNIAAHEAIDNGFTKYTPVAGIYDLREVICMKLKDDNQLVYKPQEIIVSTGAKQALANAIFTLCDQGDEVIILKPCWVSYIELVKLAESKPVLVATNEKNKFQIDIGKIKKAISNKTKAIIINSPNNPTGAVYEKNLLKKLGELAVKHDFYIITDEVYEKLVYNGEKHYSVAMFSNEIKERTITINGLSKAYAMTGWRLGYAAGPENIIKGMSGLQGHITTTTNSIAQKAALEALLGQQNSIKIMREEFDERRLYLYNRLRKMKDITCTEATGAFYLMPYVSNFFGRKFKGKIINITYDFAEFLLEEGRVAVVPGAAFEAPNYIRISYSNSIDNIKEGMDRMERTLSLLN